MQNEPLGLRALCWWEEEAEREYQEICLGINH